MGECEGPADLRTAATTSFSGRPEHRPAVRFHASVCVVHPGVRPRSGLRSLRHIGCTASLLPMLRALFCLSCAVVTCRHTAQSPTSFVVCDRRTLAARLVGATCGLPTQREAVARHTL